jgi:Fanconi-associated nuclease 1
VRAGEAAALVRETLAALGGARPAIRGVAWDVVADPEDLAMIAAGMPPGGLAAMFEQFATAAGGLSGSGMPDVTLWKPGEATRLLEVKGPGDSLSNKQRAWIDTLAAHGVDIVTCLVRAK